ATRAGKHERSVREPGIPARSGAWPERPGAQRRERESMSEASASELRVENLHASVDGHEILRGVDLVIRSGEVHAVMGPNGSGKSTLSHSLMGRADYEVTEGSVTIDGVEALGLPPHRRAALGLFLAMQYPVEVPGVKVGDLLEAALHGQGRSDGAL